VKPDDGYRDSLALAGKWKQRRAGTPGNLGQAPVISHVFREILGSLKSLLSKKISHGWTLIPTS